ncbi:MAG: AmmeMemoRadiSam system protein B [Candidatus Omnitrophica bacterium]|nr:AmmeMemoRadiSam system protein B [Candidatus Omnitrophota bacterium]
MSHVTSPGIRRAAVAGYFYPAQPEVLRETIDRLTPSGAVLRAARAVIVPHGSYARCGVVLGSTLGQVAIPRRCIVIGASHTGSWMPWSLLAAGTYRTPLGDVPVDAAAAEALRERCPFLEGDAWSQTGEHAVEVLVPFLQRLGPAGLSIVPIVTGSDDAQQLRELAAALAQTVRMSEEPVLLIASSDLSHFQPQEQAAAQDRQLIDLLCALDAEALIRYVQDRGAMMCGYGAAAAVIGAARMLEARQGTLTRYATSADAQGDPDSVIGYAGIIIE